LILFKSLLQLHAAAIVLLAFPADSSRRHSLQIPAVVIPCRFQPSSFPADSSRRHSLQIPAVVIP
jgi:hypothetical protein